VPRFQDISIKRKLTAIIMTASTVALLLVSAGFVSYELAAQKQAMADDLSTLAEIIGDRSTAVLVYGDQKEADELLASLTSKKHIVAAALYDKNGRLFASYPRGQYNTAPFPSKPERMAKPKINNDSLVYFWPVYSTGGLEGTVYLKSDLTEMHEWFTQYAGMVALLLVATWVTTLFLSSFLQRVISRPIFYLAEIAKAVSGEKNYSLRAVKHGNDELGQLIDRFNEMLQQIQKRDSELQQAHDKLEQRVEERTQDLHAEIAERERAQSALKQQFSRISFLNEITQAISDRQDTESILHVVLRQLEDHMGLDLGMVALADAQRPALNVAALRVKNSQLAKEFDLHEGSALVREELGFELCEKGQTVYFADTLKAPAAFVERLAITGWRSAVAVPLMVEEKLFGVLLAARIKPGSFSSGDCEFLRMLSEHVALAAHQARLHENLENAYNELRHTQATVLQQERLKALGQMASGIAHDVNNALSPVVGFSELILKNAHGLDANVKKYLQYIRTAGEDIAHIVTRLREFYRTREDDDSMQPVNLNHIIEQTLEMTRPRWRDIPQSHGITIEILTELATALPELPGIESEIREALTNLVLNSVDAMPKGGRISIRTRVEPAPPGQPHVQQIAIEVSDNGIGMEEETRKRCLEPFFSTKGKRGTGLGLAMVYGVVKRHEGTIDIETAPGKGSTFRLLFPVRPTVKKETADQTGDPIQSLRILCIDDEPLLRELVKEMLERDGHHVHVSDNGQSGLDEFRFAREQKKPFDVVITDLGMPYLDGRQVARAVKQESPSTPVVMLTGWGTFIKEDGSTPEQVDGIISKPPRSRELREMLSHVSPARKHTSKIHK
jgi:signal transduction histidine kinase/AmiR/NasT family two-component response regulator/HAMP domain-containing protein